MDTLTDARQRPDARLLVVEDEPNILELLSASLRYAGFEVVTAAAGTEAVQAAQRHRPDLIVLDVMLPDMDGFDVIRRLRGGGARIPVVFLTARDATEDKVKHFEAGADDYLTKPFDFAELLVRVKALLRRTPVERTDLIMLSDLEVNRLTRQVCRGGQPIELTGKEYALLEYLLSSPSRVFSRTMILNHVWDQSFEGVTNIVDVYVRHLRRKVDDPFPVKLIHTVRGVGYCVRELQPVTGPE